MNAAFRTFFLVAAICAVGGTAAAQEKRPPARERQGERFAQGPRRAPADRRGPRATPWNELSEADRKAVTQFVEENFPRMNVELERLKETAPGRYERRMTHVAQEARRLMTVKEKDPRRAAAMIREKQVGFQLQQMARDYRATADNSEKARIRDSMRKLASEEFDNRLERRKREVRDLETKLEALKGKLAEMESVRDELIDKRAKELLERGKAQNVE